MIVSMADIETKMPTIKDAIDGLTDAKEILSTPRIYRSMKRDEAFKVLSSINLARDYLWGIKYKEEE